MRHVSALRGSCVALPRGPACHVASTRAPRPFFNFYLLILLFKIENKLRKNVLKIRKNPLKIENS